MSKIPGPSQISHCRTIESLHKALDQIYRNLLDTAKADWQQLFGDEELSDACISVRVSKKEIADELAGIPGAGVVPITRSKRLNGKRRERRAQPTRR
jgi:hypothetical protein